MSIEIGTDRTTNASAVGVPSGRTLRLVTVFVAALLALTAAGCAATGQKALDIHEQLIDNPADPGEGQEDRPDGNCTVCCEPPETDHSEHDAQRPNARANPDRPAAPDRPSTPGRLTCGDRPEPEPEPDPEPEPTPVPDTTVDNPNDVHWVTVMDDVGLECDEMYTMGAGWTLDANLEYSGITGADADEIRAEVFERIDEDDDATMFLCLGPDSGLNPPELGSGDESEWYGYGAQVWVVDDTPIWAHRVGEWTEAGDDPREVLAAEFDVIEI